MSSSRNIEQALAKTQRHLLFRFMSTLLLCLLLVEMIVGAIFFFDLYQTEKKILTSMSTEYQRILTYDSSERLIHVLEANPTGYLRTTSPLIRLKRVLHLKERSSREHQTYLQHSLYLTSKLMKIVRG